MLSDVSVIEGRKLIPNVYISSLIYIASTTDPSETSELDPRTELDSHANMVLLGQHCFVFDNVHGRTCDVAPYDPSIRTAKKIPVVDAALMYDCPYTHKPYLLIVWNELYILTMENNLISLFIIREVGIKLNDVPKIHMKNPNEIDHTITFEFKNLRIPLQFNGIFSYFHTWHQGMRRYHTVIQYSLPHTVTIMILTLNTML